MEKTETKTQDKPQRLRDIHTSAGMVRKPAK